ncbi:MAG: ATP-binding cassette domain-containing protein [Bacilli bacterium]|nr:ATP-binding cassette domain-containing protein [Bacilli bacterium]
MAELKLRNVCKIYPNGALAVDNFNMDIADKEFIVFVGPSGCGKSTTLRMIAGLEEISSGECYIGTRLVNDLEPKERDIAMVFQNYALYPHMTVFKNMAFGLKIGKTKKEKRDENGEIVKDENGEIVYEVVTDRKGNPKFDKFGKPVYKMRKYTKQEIHDKVYEAAEILGITEFLDRKPKAMSGGQRQRVAIGRAIVRKPKVFLMDEPLSNLDAKLRNSMRSEILLLRKRINTTFIYVTHDQTEAMTLGDRIVIMRNGVIQQIGTPKQVFDDPANLFVAGFIGSPQMNFLPGTIAEENGTYVVSTYGSVTKLSASYAELLKNNAVSDGEIVVGVRPEHFSLTCKKSENSIPARVSVYEMMGSEYYVHCILEDDREVIVRTQVHGMDEKLQKAIEESGEVHLSFVESVMHLFNKESEESLSYQKPAPIKEEAPAVKAEPKE